jgi:glycerophosphoryl diester phosphodiesterase
VNLASRYHRDRIVEQSGQRAEKATLRLTAQTKQNEIVARQDRVDDLRYNGFVVPDDAGEEQVARAQACDQVFAHFVANRTPFHATGFDGAAQFSKGRGSCRGHTAILSEGSPAYNKPLSSSLLSKPLIYAHRGGAALRPENTLAAFDHGLSLGADGLELDVHLSRDGVVVVHHDETLERTTNGRGPLRARTAAELASLDAGYSFRGDDGGAGTALAFPFRGRGFGVPTLSQVLERYPGIFLIVELKQSHAALARATIDLLRAAGAIERTALGSFYYGVLRAARQYEPAIKTGAAQEETRWALYRSWVHWPLGRTAYRELQVPEQSGRTTIVTPEFIDHAHRASLPVKVWTVNEPADIERLLDWGVDAIISDRPDVAVDVRRRRGDALGNVGLGNVD